MQDTSYSSFPTGVTTCDCCGALIAKPLEEHEEEQEK